MGEETEDTVNIEKTDSTEDVEKEERQIKKKRRVFKNIFNLKRLLLIFSTLVSLITIMYLAAYVRSTTLDSPTVLDYDPWWWYRRAEMLLNNNMQMPKWDPLSHYPPGRPVDRYAGWTYTIAIFYKIIHPLIGTTLMEVAKWSTLIVAAATVIPAFLLGKLISGKTGGIATALFGVLTPALIGVSMGGYCDTDMIVVFYTFLSVYAFLLAIKKRFTLKAIPFYIFAIVVGLAFVYTWRYGWIIPVFFSVFIPILFVFRSIEQVTHNRRLRLNVGKITSEMKKILIPLVVIVVLMNILGLIFNISNIVSTFLLGLRFYGGKALLVNISVAELQIINIFTRRGFEAVVGRVGLGPVLFTLILPILAFYKIYRREEIEHSEIFLYLWVLITFVLINRGVRFSLLFSTATAAAAGYAIGNIPKYIKNRFVKSTFFGFTALIMVMFVSTAISTGYASRGMRISDNWYNMLDWLKANADPDSLVVTWWDPGHIIAGYTGLHVHADGAHCPVYPADGSCVPYNHNDRIQDMGRTFSISDENESLSILRKYKKLTSEQCVDAKEKMKKTFGITIPDEYCREIPEMYVIASNDLIGKYYWMSYFGTGTGRNYFQMQMTNYIPDQGVIEYNNGQLQLVWDNGQWLPVLNFPEQGVRNAVVSHIVYFENGEERRFNYTDRTNVVNGMVWVDPGYGIAMFMDPVIRDSVFTRMFFFNGEGLQNFELVYQNLEIRLFKVIF